MPAARASLGPAWTPILVGLLLVTAARAEVRLPAGFTLETYVSGERLEGSRGAPGIPATSTLAFDERGTLYLARAGRRYWSAGEGDDLTPIYRIPIGGARLAPDTESRFLHGPPLLNPMIAGLRGGHELLVTTFDRDRRIGVLYRLLDGRAQLLAGGTPLGGGGPVLRQPEAAVADRAGRLYVAERDQGAIVRLDPGGRVLDPRWLEVRRPRVLAMDGQDHLWVGADANAEAPWQTGPGEVWRVTPEGAARLLLSGPVPAGIALSPAGHLVVADRQAGRLLAVAADGRQTELATFTDGDAPRAVTFAPDTPATRRAGLAGDLFVVLIQRGAWQVNDVARLRGPLDELIRRRLATTP